MNIVGISDLHGQLSGYTIPEADILCICGDISPLKFQFNIPSMDGWFKKDLSIGVKNNLLSKYI